MELSVLHLGFRSDRLLWPYLGASGCGTVGLITHMRRRRRGDHHSYKYKDAHHRQDTKVEAEVKAQEKAKTMLISAQAIGGRSDNMHSHQDLDDAHTSSGY